MTPDHLSYTPPLTIGAWLACLFFVVALFNASTKAYKNLKGPAAQPANELLGASHIELERRITDVENDIKDLRKDLATSSTGVTTKIEDLRHEIKSDLDKQTERFERRFDDLPTKVITMLKNTGAIGNHHRRSD